MISLVLLLAQSEPAEEASREPVLVVLLALVVGIAIVGAILVVMVAIWGSRTRRVSREGLPEVRDPDPFAVLRAEARRNTRPPVNETELPDDELPDNGSQDDGPQDGDKPDDFSGGDFENA